MYIFAMAVLAGVGIVALAHCFNRVHPVFEEYRPFTLVLLGLGAAWMVDFDLWARFGVPAREEWIGVVLTGLTLAGLAYVCHEVMDFFHGLSRKTNDEAAALEKTQGLKAA